MAITESLFFADYSQGFGGKYGVQKDRVDKSAAGWDEVERAEAHPSQVDHKKGFGGKYGLAEQKDKVHTQFKFLNLALKGAFI